MNDVIRATSSVCKNTLAPKWNDRLEVTVPKETKVTDELRLEVWDQDTLSKGSFLGQYVIRGNQISEGKLISEYGVRQSVPLAKKPTGSKPSQKHVKRGATVEILFEPPKRGPVQQHVLLVSVESASGIVKADMFGKSDPYCEVFLADGVDENLVAVTNVAKKTLNPVWGEEFEVHVPAEPKTSDELTFKVFDKDLIGKDDFLGQVVLKCAELKSFASKEFPSSTQPPSPKRSKRKSREP